MRALRFLNDLLYPPTCRGCGERFDVFRTAHLLPLCPACLDRWAMAGTERCEFCGGYVSLCDCMPVLLREAGCSALVKAVGYHAGQKQLPERLILQGKRCRDRELFRFFASDLQLKVWQALECVGGVGDACVTYVPRRRSAAWQAGVDQGKELARALSSALELPFRCVLRNFARAEQKKLDFADRAKNAQAAIAVARRADLGSIRGKTVVLVDDITTAGATLAAGCRALLDAGAARVICCVVAHTQG